MRSSEHYLQSSRITVDDLGIHECVEAGVHELACFDIPIYCSWMTNFLPPSEKYLAEDNFRSGLHFNIIEGRSDLGSVLISDENSNFSLHMKDFVFASKKIKNAVEDEFEFQYEKAVGWFGKEISHVDSHLHIHSIPWIFSMLERKKKKYKYRFLRNPFQYFKDDYSIFIKPHVFIKCAMLRFFSLINPSSEYPCFGISCLFSMEHKKVLKAVIHKKREIIWHACRAGEGMTIDARGSRFFNKKQIIKRDNELNELIAFLGEAKKLTLL